MLAIGCLIPFVMLAVGAGVGSYLGNGRGGYLGAGGGFGSGLLVAVAAVIVLSQVRRDG